MYTAAQVNDTTVRIFDARNGMLKRTITLPGKIIGAVVASGDVLTVPIKMGSQSVLKTFKMPGGNLIGTTSIS